MTPPAAAASSVQRGAKLAPPRPRPRRVSGPVKPAGRSSQALRPRYAPAGAQGGLVLGLLGAVETLSTHRLLDRLIRGRVWIGLLAFALIGIVTLQLGLLKLNSGIGRAIERSAKLQTENAALSIENSELASGDRVESEAARLGMKLVSIDGLHFLSSHARGDVAHAAAALSEPVRRTSSETSEATSATTSEAPTEAPVSGESESTEAEVSATSSSESSVAESSEAPASSSTESQAPATSIGEAATAGVGGGTASPAG